MLTQDAKLVCLHEMGKVNIRPTQDIVTIQHRFVLVETDPEGRSISGCPNVLLLAGIRSCQTTLKVRQGYSEFIRIEKRRICLDTVRGLTDGTPPGVVDYKVNHPGQQFVAEQ